ncbi:MAG TPA: hypothetical protein PK685_00790 [archaeon]|jgi:DNA-directed RNA polymerase subunit L|nr:hypothetical protein [archaeon]
MDIEFINKNKNEIEFIVKDEDSSFFDMIINIASTKKDVEFVSKKNADNLVNEFTIYLRTRDKPAKDVLLDCINEAEEEFNGLIKNLEKAVTKK